MVSYPVPQDAPEEVAVLCAWSPAGEAIWQPAKVTPFVSETALRLVPGEEWNEWIGQGRITERRAAGLMRTLCFNPYPEAQEGGRVAVDFRIEVQSAEGTALAVHMLRLEADFSDVTVIEDWSSVFQQNALDADAEADGAHWSWRTDLPPEKGVSLGNALYGDAGPDTPLPPLSYPLDLKGWYAIFVHVPGSIRLRLTGDERDDLLSSRRGRGGAVAMDAHGPVSMWCSGNPIATRVALPRPSTM